MNKLILASFACLSFATGCAQALPGDNPGDNVLLYFPTALAASADGSAVYIVNSNFDQRFNTGWMTRVDVAAALSSASPRDALKRQALIPSLGSRVALSVDGTQAFVPHRGLGLLTVLDLPAVTCKTAGSDTSDLVSSLRTTDCDRAHLIDLAQSAVSTTAQVANYTYTARDFQDPYSVTVLPQTNLMPSPGKPALAVGYLNSGWLSVLTSDGTGLPSVLGNISVGGGGTIASLTGHADSRVLGTSRQFRAGADLSAVYDIDIAASLPRKDAAAQFVQGDVAATLGGTDITASVFSPDESHVYVTNRGPDAVAILSASPFPQTTAIAAPGALPVAQGIAAWQLTGSVAMDHAQPSDVLYFKRPQGDLLIVASLAQDTLYFFAPRGDSLQLVQRVQLHLDGGDEGQGPSAMALVNHAGQDYLFVTTFFDHGLAIIDVSGADYADFKVSAFIHEGDLGIATRSR